MFDASLNFSSQQQRVVMALGLALCAVILVLLTRRQIAAFDPSERWKFAREGMLTVVLLAAFWVVVAVQLVVMVR